MHYIIHTLILALYCLNLALPGKLPFPDKGVVSQVPKLNATKSLKTLNSTLSNPQSTSDVKFPLTNEKVKVPSIQLGKTPTQVNKTLENPSVDLKVNSSHNLYYKHKEQDKLNGSSSSIVASPVKPSETKEVKSTVVKSVTQSPPVAHTVTAAPPILKPKVTAATKESHDKVLGSSHSSIVPKESSSHVGGVAPNDQSDFYENFMKPGMVQDDRSSHFFAYLLTFMVLVILCYLVFHNKQKILALILEGRSNNNRRQRGRAKYHKLDNNLEEAMTSTNGGSSMVF